MARFNFSEAKKNIEEIVQIVQICPEPLQKACFEMLFAAAFSASSESETPGKPKPAVPAAEPEEKKQPLGQANDFKLPSNLLAFSRKYDVSMEMLQKLFILDHEPLLPIYKITTKVTRTAQLQKVMMILLENGLLNNQLKAPYVELRAAVNEAGFFDSNFNKALKGNHELFKGAVTKDKIVEAEAIELTGAGYQALADIVKELAQPTS